MPVQNIIVYLLHMDIPSEEQEIQLEIMIMRQQHTTLKSQPTEH